MTNQRRLSHDWRVTGLIPTTAAVCPSNIKPVSCQCAQRWKPSQVCERQKLWLLLAIDSQKAAKRDDKFSLKINGRAMWSSSKQQHQQATENTAGTRRATPTAAADSTRCAAHLLPLSRLTSHCACWSLCTPVALYLSVSASSCFTFPPHRVLHSVSLCAGSSTRARAGSKIQLLCSLLWVFPSPCFFFCD